MIYTSYFSKLRELPLAQVTPVSISLSTPGGVEALQYHKLSPSWSILSEYKRTFDEEHYRQRFEAEILANLNADDVVKELRDLSYSDDIVLLCYERPEKFCHRHLVADWLKENGYACKEWRSE